ncbi:TPA-induced transmembrane protein-like [Solea solea]|uniref:TPA-induced transmembrane protein-like n=1 Tax=Solea solea TaxID=90069 RepID=UPI00272D0C92|nr:TPA-induced transmembrane protein-like [Solea solea]
MNNMEMKPLHTNGNDAAAHLNERVTAVNGDSTDKSSAATERDVLLSRQGADHNGDAITSSHEMEAQTTVGCTYDSKESSTISRILRELNSEVLHRVKLWMALILIAVVIVAVVLISLAACAALHEDVDDMFDPSLFIVPLNFNGSFQLPNQVFTEELFIFSSNESQTLSVDLQEKLSDLYRASPALGRYFSTAEIYALRNGSVIADYQLSFLLPEEQQEELRNFTLSREMVYNVFRQFLYDQEIEQTSPMYIYPRSLFMF